MSNSHIRNTCMRRAYLLIVSNFKWNQTMLYTHMYKAYNGELESQLIKVVY